MSDPDETAGRALYRARAEAEARRSLAETRKVQLLEVDLEGLEKVALTEHRDALQGQYIGWEPSSEYARRFDPPTILALLSELRALRGEVERLKVTTCFECDTDLVGPICPACNPSLPAARVFDLISNAYYEGFVECTKHQPWDDMFDWAALKGQDHARAAVEAQLSAQPTKGAADGRAQDPEA